MRLNLILQHLDGSHSETHLPTSIKMKNWGLRIFKLVTKESFEKL